MPLLRYYGPAFTLVRGDLRLPVLKQHIALAARGLRALLSLGTGGERDRITPGYQTATSKELATSERTQTRAEEVARLHRRLAATEAELSEARANLAKQRFFDKETPVFFVVGQPKSGTGWLMKILNSHPEILCKGGGRFFGRELRNEEAKAVQAARVVNAKNPPSSLHNAMLDAEYLKLWIESSVWSRDDDPEEHLAKLTRLAIDHFLMEKLSKTNKRLVGDKTPLFTTDVLKETILIYPEAKLIHIVRDGRDVAVSWMHQLWKKDLDGMRKLKPEELAKRRAFYQNPQVFLASGEGIFLEDRLRSTAEGWRESVGRAVEDGPGLLGNNYAEVRYENLLERPEEETKRLLDFLGADTREKIVRRCVRSASFEVRSGRERGQENYTLDHGKHRKGIAGDWKNVFTERDKAVFKEAAGNLLIELGYEKDDNW
jgi:hypothetical protein